MARKTVTHTTNADAARADHRREAAIDAASDARDAARRQNVGALPSLAVMRERRHMMTAPELIAQCRRASRVALRGAMYSAEDRADVAAEVAARVLAELSPSNAAPDAATGGASAATLPRRDAKRVGLTRLVGDAHNLRRAIDARRRHDDAELKREAAEDALSADALGISETLAEHAAIVARSSRANARRAASAICRELNLPDGADAPHWCVFYQWARDAIGEVCAEECGVKWPTWKVRVSRGAKFIRGFYDAAELIGRLTDGAAIDAESGAIVYAMRDQSRDARHWSKPLADSPHAPHWRTPSYDAAESLAECETRKTRKRSKRDAHAYLTAKLAARWHGDALTLREARKLAARGEASHATLATLAAIDGDTLEVRADALTNIARAYAREARRERAAESTSTLAELKREAA